MIASVLDTVSEELAVFLKSIPGLVEGNLEPVRQGLIVKMDGQLAETDRPVIVSVVNVEEERTAKAQSPVRKTVNNRIRFIEPEIAINIYVLFSVLNVTYTKTLQYLSNIVLFFQSKSVFTRQTSPGLDERIEKVMTDLHSLDFEQQNHLWGSLGAKYQPSVMYRIRLLPMKLDLPSPDYPPILNVNTTQRQV